MDFPNSAALAGLVTMVAVHAVGWSPEFSRSAANGTLKGCD
jgi:hypothetical protein